MPSDVKSMLKQVKEAIKTKDYKTVIIKSQKILKQDPTNYLALIFLGAAYQETDKKEAAKYLKTALTCTNEPIAALQGLANCADVEELPDIYKQLLPLVPDKYLDYHVKLATVASNESVWEKCVNVFKDDIDANPQNVERVKSARLKITAILCNQKVLPETFNELFSTCLQFSIENCDNENKLLYFKRYLKQLYKQDQKTDLFEQARRMSECYPEEIYPLEWICKLYIESFGTECHNVFSGDIERYYEKLLEKSELSSQGRLAKAIQLYSNRQYTTCRDILLQINQAEVDSITLLSVLSKCYINLYAFELAENILRQLNDIKSSDFLKCLVYKEENDNLNEAIELGSELLSLQPSTQNLTLEFLIRAHVRLGNLNAAAEFADRLNKLDETETGKFIQAEYFQTALEAIKTLSSLKTQSFRKNFLLGIKYIEIGDHEKALLSLAHATREQPYNSMCFFLLGQVYASTSDFSSAKKCFEKCFNLNPRNERAICHLLSIYKSNEEWDTGYKMLEKALLYFQGRKRKWVHFRLGQQHLYAGNADEAINYFRSAVRQDIQDIKSWEGLANAYQQRGSYNSALKVYAKILELDAKNAYAKLQIGVIKTILKMFDEAVDSFDQLLLEYPDYLPGLKGSAECHYSLAVKLHRQRLIGRCKENLQKAANRLQKAILTMKRELTCIWRLLANVFIMTACLPKSKAYLDVLGKLAGQEEDTVRLESCELFELGARFYLHIIKTNENDSFLWHELALCYYHYTKNLGDDHPKVVKWLKLAIDCCKNSLKMQPTRWQNWNLLGVLFTNKAVNNLALAQHSFIKALELNRKSAVAWTNLGVLYLSQGQAILANKCFGKSQQSDTGYLNAWIGQGIIAEMLGHQEEAMDLFRHCTQLDFHTESAAGYAFWVCSTLSNREAMKDPNNQYAIKNMFAVPVALDSIYWYRQSEENMAQVAPISYFGFLSLHQNHFRDATQSFQYAADRTSQDDKDKMLCNLAFTYLKNEHPSQAVETFKLITTATFQSTIGLALALYKCEKYEDSYSAYSSALEWLANTDEEKCAILLGMSSVAYGAHEYEDAKNLLLQCIRFSNPPAQALFATCAFAILHNEPELTEAVLEALEHYESNEEFTHHIAFLTSQVYLANGQVKQGLIYLLSLIHKFPNHPQTRKVCVDYLMRTNTTSQKLMFAASRLAEGIIALNLRHSKSSRNYAMEAAKSLALASTAMKLVDINTCKKLAQRAVHMNPQCKEAWSALNSCMVK